MRKLISLLQPVIYPAIKWYYRKPRTIQKRGIELKLNPSVFHPSYYLSTDLFLDFLLEQDLEGKSLLELGTGNGFIALYLAKNHKMEIHASDINSKAIEGLIENAQTNEVKVNTYFSDLFDDIPFLNLDYLILNPPYFSKAVQSVDEYAFFTGENLAYFHKFFKQIPPYIENQTKIYMILSENAAITEIEALAEEYKISLKVIFETLKNEEQFLIYSVF